MRHVIVVVRAEQQAKQECIEELPGAEGVSFASRSRGSLEATGG